MSQHTGNDNPSSFDQDQGHSNTPGGSTRYSSHRGGFSGRGYYRGGGQGKYSGFNYDNVDNSAQSYNNNYGSYRGYSNNGSNYRSEYYYNGQGQSHGQGNNRYYSRGGYYGSNENYDQPYQSENEYQYYAEGDRGVNGHFQGRTYHSGPPPTRNQHAYGRPYHPPSGNSHGPFKRSFDASSHVSTENYNRHSSQPSPVNPPARNSPVASIPSKRRVDKEESPFFYLTDLDKSTEDTEKLERIKQVFRESSSLDKKIEEEKLKVLKNELELSLLTTQCERDSLNVQLTQEKLDSLLMQG